MELQSLRDDLAQVDRRILELVTRRQRLVEAVGLAKLTSGAAIRDYRQEREVLQRAARVAAEQGLEPEIGEEVMGLLIRHALTAQERQRVATSGSGGGRTALVIGGGGRMGGWFVDFLASQGYDVEVADPAGGRRGHAHREDWRTSPLKHDLIVVATDLTTSAALLEEIAERRPGGLVFDIASLKAPLAPGLTALERAGVRFASIHPMFGPDTELLSGRHVIFVEAGPADATAEVEALFASTMAESVRMSLEEHDRVMAFVLGLSHALNLAFATALAQSGEAAPRLSELSSTTFEEQLAVASRVASENPHLYFEIQSLNEFGDRSLAALEAAVGTLRQAVRRADEEAFAGLMETGRRYLERRQG